MRLGVAVMASTSCLPNESFCSTVLAREAPPELQARSAAKDPEQPLCRYTDCSSRLDASAEINVPSRRFEQFSRKQGTSASAGNGVWPQWLVSG